MENVMESKLLDFNLDKSCAILMGAKGVKDEIENELKENPLTLCDQTMKCLPMEKYLGDIIWLVAYTPKWQKGELILSSTFCSR